MITSSRIASASNWCASFFAIAFAGAALCEGTEAKSPYIDLEAVEKKALAALEEVGRDPACYSCTATILSGQDARAAALVGDVELRCKTKPTCPVGPTLILTGYRTGKDIDVTPPTPRWALDTRDEVLPWQHSVLEHVHAMCKELLLREIKHLDAAGPSPLPGKHIDAEDRQRIKRDVLAAAASVDAAAFSVWETKGSYVIRMDPNWTPSDVLSDWGCHAVVVRESVLIKDNLLIGISVKITRFDSSW